MPNIRKLSAEEVQRLANAQADREPAQMAQSTQPQGLKLDGAYPHVADWIAGGGWIELGQNEYSRSFIRILDIGGMLWEGTRRHKPLDALLNDAEQALIQLEERGDI